MNKELIFKENDNIESVLKKIADVYGEKAAF